MDQDFQKAIKDYDLSEKAQNALIINNINSCSSFLSVDVKKLYYTEKGYKQTKYELSCFQDMLNQKQETLRIKLHTEPNLIAPTEKKRDQNKKTASNAIEELINEKGLPQKKQNIIQALAEEFTEEEITESISNAARFINTDNQFYNRKQTWQKRSYLRLIKSLPKPVAEFVEHFVNLNKNSYTLVLICIFIQNMNTRGSMKLIELEELFCDFYLSRQKKGLLVESNTSMIGRIGKLKESYIKNQNCIEVPLTHVLFSGFFYESFRNKRIDLKPTFSIEFSINTLIRDKVIIIFQKAIEDYYQKIEQNMALFERKSEARSKIEKFDSPKSEANKVKESMNNDNDNNGVTVSEQRKQIKESHIPEKLTSELSVKVRSQSTKDGFLVRTQNLQESSQQELIERLPDSIAKFTRHLLLRNESSYVSVMAFVFIKNMDIDASININKLYDLFYDFYLHRMRNNLPIEKNGTMVNKIGELSKNKIQWTACPAPFQYLLASEAFKTISHSSIRLKISYAEDLSNNNVKDLLLLIIHNAIKEYYQNFVSKVLFPEQKSEAKNDDQVSNFSKPNPLFDPVEDDSATLSIKKKKRGKIRL